jgi:hypothetical protein
VWLEGCSAGRGHVALGGLGRVVGRGLVGGSVSLWLEKLEKEEVEEARKK